MRKLTIPLYIPEKNNEIDYDSLINIINEIDDCNILIGNYNLNKMNDLKYINVYLFLSIIDKRNTYYLEKDYKDSILKVYKENEKDYINILGNIIPNELKEYLENIDQNIDNKILNKYINIFNKIIIDNEKNVIEYILTKQNKINTSKYKEIDNLLGFKEL